MQSVCSFSISLGPSAFHRLHNSSEATLEMLLDHCRNASEKDG